MSYISNIGENVDASIQAADKDYSKALRPFKSGTTHKVRLLGLADRAEYFSHSVYKVFYTAIHQPNDLYCQARKILFSEADAAADPAEKEKLLEMAKELRPTPRYLFGFGALDGENAGEQIVLDMTKNQAKVLIDAINKLGKKKDGKAFEISKNGTSTATTVSMMPVDLEDLSEKEKKAFDAFDGAAFDSEIFGNVFQLSTEEQQLQDLQKFGFDITKLTGGSAQSASAETQYDF